LYELEQLGEEEEGHEHREQGHADDQYRAGEVALAKEAHGKHRRRGSTLDEHECDEDDGGGREGDDRGAVGERLLPGSDDGVDQRW